MLDTIPVTHVPGVGAAKQKCLADFNLYTVEDLLKHFPRRFEDRRAAPFETFEDGQKVTAHAMVEGQANIRWQGKRSVCTATLRVDQRHRVLAIWFNQPYLKQKLTDGRVLTITGKFDKQRNTIVVGHTDFRVTGPSHEDEWVPVYSVPKGMTSAQLQGMIQKALERYWNQIDELLPLELRQKYRLIPHREAIRAMHFPKTEDDVKQAHRRLAFEEFFLFQVQLQWFRAQRIQTTPREKRSISHQVLKDFQQVLPAQMTEAQVNACHHILDDLTESSVMNRLIQGDVGSGKTWVALFATYAVALDGQQTAFMAPTEILVEQHYREASERLGPLGIQVGMLTGSTPERERRRALHQLKTGEVKLVVGTHALLTPDVEFHDLGLVVTDEQHRFGVAQRGVLREKGHQPDVLFLSATPIPRTLALAIYGDMDVSVIDQMPSGRRVIETKWMKMEQESDAIRKVRQEIAKGRQAYVVAPLVDESEEWADVTSATEIFKQFVEQFAGFTVALLHGRMPGREKEQVMRAFANHDVHILVSTTVIEVGINVPNATVMLVYHAERFGLAQLHQLRGRVGRGVHQSYCILLSTPRNDMARRRLETMVDTTSGFVIAEEDLQLRGPGEFHGVRQSGLPEFSVGDLSRDLRVMEVARDEATQLLSNPDFWLLPQYERLREWIQADALAHDYKD